MITRNLSLSLALATSFALTTGAFANAGNRQALDTDMLNRVFAVENGQNLLRVYPSRRMVIKRSTKIGSDIEVDDGVNLELNGKIRKETLKRTAAGKILKMEKVTTFGGYAANFLRVYVSFDQSCTTVDCAFVFENPVDLQYVYGWQATLLNETFQLAQIPAGGPFSQIDAIWLGRKPLFKRAMETAPAMLWSDNILDTTARRAQSLTLEIDVDELMNIEKESVVHDGW